MPCRRPICALGALGSLRSRARLSTWLVCIVINEVLGRLRRRGAQVLAFNATIDLPGISMEDVLEGNPDDRPDRGAMRSEICVVMEAFIDLSVDEVPAALGLPEATVRTRFFRARGLLREGLACDTDHALADAFSFDGARSERIMAGVIARLDERADGTGS